MIPSRRPSARSARLRRSIRPSTIDWRIGRQERPATKARTVPRPAGQVSHVSSPGAGWVRASIIPYLADPRF